ncbi:MAG: hypothetical protein ACK2UW_14245 [Anaerolineales bacterium]|jgi:hypothetical protein
MTTKNDFTTQEWEDLLQAPILAGMVVIISDVSVTAMGRELKGLFNAILAQDAPPDAQELVAAVVADYTARAERNEKLEQPELDNDGDPKQQLMDQLKQNLSVLDTKSSPAEKAGFCTWLLQVAQATAEAGREGGFLGIGSVRVSDLEQAALEELRQAFELA